ncbi:hypothetical protein CK203_035859 [Vitis vinifera]|uniref:Uncharacterized protein n=1 Tax=Vitis vinifera TaxID=29760 RepID=A0A438I009_VITVI|nr:hypothetical protein CK203_035859 [Vitis vinifera]
MPKTTMKRLEIATKELTRSRLMIQGFNQGGQRAIGMIRLRLVTGGVKKVETDAKPFTEVESYFVDAKFYIENDAMEEVLPAIIPSTGKAKFERKV